MGGGENAVRQFLKTQGYAELRTLQELQTAVAAKTPEKLFINGSRPGFELLLNEGGRRAFTPDFLVVEASGHGVHGWVLEAKARSVHLQDNTKYHRPEFMDAMRDRLISLGIIPVAVHYVSPFDRELLRHSIQRLRPGAQAPVLASWMLRFRDDGRPDKMLGPAYHLIYRGQEKMPH